MKVCIYNRVDGSESCTVELGPGNRAVVKGANKHVKQWLRDLTVVDENGPVKPTEGVRYIKALSTMPDTRLIT